MNLPSSSAVVPAGTFLGLLAVATPSTAQVTSVQTPGMPNWSQLGQQDRFSNVSNPAFGAMFDAFGTWTDEDGATDGADLFLRSFEMTLNGRVDPNWWGYGVVVLTEDEVVLEEAAAFYDGFDGNASLRFGRFYVDFGKQMQAHTHDLPYFERPGVLSEYLGEELSGTGLQADNWWATGDASAIRASVGLFGSYGLDHDHGHGEEEAEEGAELELPGRKTLDEFGLTARVTQFMDVGERGVFQWGVSARHIGAFAFHDEASGAEVDDLTNTVLGVDLTYGVDSEDGLSGWTFGGEFLANTGDLSAEDDGGGGLEVLNDERYGYYLWAERRLNVSNTVGALYSSFEHAEEDAPVDREITAYWSHYFSEFSRLRVGGSYLDSEENGERTQLLVQLTAFFGPHAHGVNW